MRVKINKISTKKLRGNFLSDPQTISLHGHSYDALSGKPIKEENDSKTKPAHHHNHVKVVDGFFRSTKKSSAKNLAEKNRKLSHHKIAPHIGRATEHSKTLMRTGVKKPLAAKVVTKQKLAKNHINYFVSKSVAATAPARNEVAERAKAIKHSEFVGKFSELAKPANPITPDPETIQTTANSEVHLKNLEHLSQIESNPDIDDAFTQAALNISSSHITKSAKKMRFYDRMAESLKITVRTLIVISVALVVLIVAGVTLYIFMPNLSMYIADSKTGVHGILPEYTPSGFSVKNIKYITGNPTGSITLSYKSNSDSRSYNITEHATSWDNQSLINGVIEPLAGSNFTSNQVGGISVFNTGKSDFWISSNVYYILNNQANLTQNQINQIVTST